MAPHQQNRYLVARDGRSVGSGTATVIGVIVLLASSNLAVLAGVLAGYWEAGCVVGTVLVLGTTLAVAVRGRRARASLDRATQAVRAGDAATAVALCHRSLLAAVGWDTRQRGLYLLGHCAEADGQFAEAEDLFARAHAAVPWNKRGSFEVGLMHAHRAIALVALGRLDEADAVVGEAEAGFRPQGASRLFGPLPDDVGAASLRPDLRALEPRDPRVLLTLTRSLVLAARGRGADALALIECRRPFLLSALFARERALLANIESRSRGLPGGAPLRSPARLASGDRWADSVLAP